MILRFSWRVLSETLNPHQAGQQIKDSNADRRLLLGQGQEQARNATGMAVSVLKVQAAAVGFGDLAAEG